MTEKIEIGARVRLKSEGSHHWRAPFDKFAASGRPATLYDRNSADRPMLRFDVARKNARPRTMVVDDRDIERLPNA